MNRRSSLSRHQRQLLEGVRALGLCTDESVVARLAELGEQLDRSTLVRWRAGERTAPLGLLPILLGHVDDPSAVLDLLARPLGLRVVPDVDADTDERTLVDRALEVAERSGDVVSTLRAAQAAGELGDLERHRAVSAVELARRTLAELAAVLGAA